MLEVFISEGIVGNNYKETYVFQVSRGNRIGSISGILSNWSHFGNTQTFHRFPHLSRSMSVAKTFCHQEVRNPFFILSHNLCAKLGASVKEAISSLKPEETLRNVWTFLLILHILVLSWEACAVYSEYGSHKKAQTIGKNLRKSLLPTTQAHLIIWP